MVNEGLEVGSFDCEVVMAQIRQAAEQRQAAYSL